MSKLPTIDNYLDVVLRSVESYPELRIGQIHWNMASQIRPDIVERYRGNPDIDPFHRDANVPVFVQLLRDEWGNWGSWMGLDIKDWYLRNQQDWFKTDGTEHKDNYYNCG